MTLPRTVAQVLSEHVVFELRCVDRVLATLYQPRLQYGSGIRGFFCYHRGNRFVSSTLMHPMTERFTADIHHYIAANDLDLVHFTKGQSKDEIAKAYLASHDGSDRVLFVGRAQEKTTVWRTRQRRDATTGMPYPWLVKDTSMVNHFYFYGFDADFGPFFVKFCSYFPFTAQIYLNGHEYAKTQAAKAGIGFTPLDNAFAAVDDVAAVQEICDDMTPDRIEALARKWLRRLPTPFTVDDEDADYYYDISIQQIEFSTTHVLDRPRSGRFFFDQLIRDNIDIGRPDKVSVIFGRTVRRRGKHPTPGPFHTRVITHGVDVSVYAYYKSNQLKQYLKEGKALRTETTINRPRDFGIGKRLENLPALAEVGYAANRRLLEVQRISHDPATGVEALTAITTPVITSTGTRIPGLRFTDSRVQALLSALCTLAPLPHGFTNRILRTHLAPLIGLTSEDMTTGQLTYDLRRLRAHRIIERIPATNRYRLTAAGTRYALFLTRLAQHFLVPGLAQIVAPDPPVHTRLRAASRVYEAAIASLAADAGLSLAT
jgi:hypothetical protein